MGLNFKLDIFRSLCHSPHTYNLSEQISPPKFGLIAVVLFIQRELDCPTTHIPSTFSHVGVDSLVIRSMMDEVRITVPETLLFTFRSDMQVSCSDKVTPVVLRSNVGMEKAVSDAVSRFINSFGVTDIEKVSLHNL